MRDIKGKTLSVGDEIAYAPNGAYSGVSIGIIEKFTPKQVGIRSTKGGAGRHMFPSDERLYYTYSKEVLKIK